MFVNEGVKHLFVRTLVTLINETEYHLEARLCPDFLVGQETEENTVDVDNNSENSVEEEIFENQRSQSGKGWGHPTLPNDPGHWCSRELSGSSTVRRNLSITFTIIINHHVCGIVLYCTYALMLRSS